jgi:hypothetical protein
MKAGPQVKRVLKTSHTLTASSRKGQLFYSKSKREKCKVATPWLCSLKAG